MWKSPLQEDPRQGPGLHPQYGSLGQFSWAPHPPGVGRYASPFPPCSYSTKHVSDTQNPFLDFCAGLTAYVHRRCYQQRVSFIPGNSDCFQVVVFCMVVELRGGGASVSPRGRVADGEAPPWRARACHSKDLRKLSPLLSRHFRFPL